MSDPLRGLVPEFRAKAAEVITNCRAKTVSMVASQGLRTPYQQAIYWRQSRTRTQVEAAISTFEKAGATFLAQVLESVGPRSGPQVTNALPGASWHQWGEALDCYWEVDGKVEWSLTRKVNGVNGYAVYAEVAKASGLDAGYYWPRFKDSPHIQLRRTANPLKAGLSWPEIDAVMRDRFGTAAPSTRLKLDHEFASPALEAIRLSYEAPEGWRVWETTDVSGALFRAKMAVCADGAPKAYHRDDAKALDYLANAGRPGNWWGIVTDDQGQPVVQDSNDPAPGFYVSTTALNNPGADPKRPARYVDADKTAYVVLPQRRFPQFATTKTLRLGDLGVAYNTRTGDFSYTQFAETGPQALIGEASIGLARAVGVNADAKRGGTPSRIILYLVFPGSGPGRGLSQAEIDARAAPLFEAWGGLARLRTFSDLS